MSTLHALVVDDEEPARRRVLDLLAREADWESTAIDNGVDAIAAILDHPPDLVFLDIEMPEANGFEVIRQVGIARMPPVIFVTAYDEYALQAFEACAIDYLLKPFADARFQQALRRSEERIRLAELESLRDRLTRLLHAMDSEGDGVPAASARRNGAPRRSDESVTRIPVQSRDRTVLVPVRDVDYVSADGPYMCLHVGERELLIRERMHTLERRLVPEGFLRIHRSTLVNLDRVVAIEPYFRGEAFVQLSSGGRLKVSRSRRAELYATLGIAEPTGDD